MAPLDLNEAVENMSKLLLRLIGEDIHLELKLDRDTKKIQGDRGQIEQVLMNLAVNARDALPKGGTLRIETATTYLDADYARAYFEVEPGPYVMLTVSDTGCGMDKETQKRIFEPFFTTKAQGKGTGLGLSTVYGIVKQHGGHMRVFSEPGQGTTFKVYFPRHPESEAETTKAVEELPTFEGSETVLVVEDEKSVRKLIQRVLEASGYQVLVAANAEQAEKIFEEHPSEIDLLLTDVVMPGRNGPSLYQHLLRKRPSLKVLFMSGYTDAAILPGRSFADDPPYIQKPFAPISLTEKIREVLDGKEPNNFL